MPEYTKFRQLGIWREKKNAVQLCMSWLFYVRLSVPSASD